MTWPDLILGSAMWGWTVDRERCFFLLDEFYGLGFRQVDTATNYPIDGRAEHFRLAESWLLEWIGAHGIKDLQVIVKVGSVNNSGSPENLLNKSFLMINLDDYRYRFGSNLHTFSLHWDNRSAESEIRETLEVLAQAAGHDLRPGLSGIRHPEVYALLNGDFGLRFRIQCKHHVFQSGYEHYRALHGHDFIAYGTNAGGFKLDGRYRPDSSWQARGGRTPVAEAGQEALRALLGGPIRQFFQLGLLFAAYHPAMTGILIGPSSSEQLAGNVAFYEQLKTTDFRSTYEALRAFHAQEH